MESSSPFGSTDMTFALWRPFLSYPSVAINKIVKNVSIIRNLNKQIRKITSQQIFGAKFKLKDNK